MREMVVYCAPCDCCRWRIAYHKHSTADLKASVWFVLMMGGRKDVAQHVKHGEGEKSDPAGEGCGHGTVPVGFERVTRPRLHTVIFDAVGVAPWLTS